jgi:hypothetical protein
MMLNSPTTSILTNFSGFPAVKRIPTAADNEDAVQTSAL